MTFDKGGTRNNYFTTHTLRIKASIVIVGDNEKYSIVREFVRRAFSLFFGSYCCDLKFLISPFHFYNIQYVWRIFQTSLKINYNNISAIAIATMRIISTRHE